MSVASGSKVKLLKSRKISTRRQWRYKLLQILEQSCCDNGGASCWDKREQTCSQQCCYNVLKKTCYKLMSPTTCQQLVPTTLIRLVVNKLGTSCSNNLLQVCKPTSCNKLDVNKLVQHDKSTSLLQACWQLATSLLSQQLVNEMWDFYVCTTAFASSCCWLLHISYSSTCWKWCSSM